VTSFKFNRFFSYGNSTNTLSECSADREEKQKALLQTVDLVSRWFPIWYENKKTLQQQLLVIGEGMDYVT
jgi:hypothetical protein